MAKLSEKAYELRNKYNEIYYNVIIDLISL